MASEIVENISKETLPDSFCELIDLSWVYVSEMELSVVQLHWDYDSDPKLLLQHCGM